MRRFRILILALVVGMATAAAAESGNSSDPTPSLEYRPQRLVIPEPKAPHPLPPKTVFAETVGSFGIMTGSFDSPVDVARDESGNFYVLDAGNSRVQKFDKSANYVVSSGSSGSHPGQFKRPAAIAVGRLDPADPATEVVYVVDTGNDRVQFTATAGFGMPGVGKLNDGWEKWGSRGSWKGDFKSPRDITIDPRGYVYVLDSGNERVQKFLPRGELETGNTFELFKGEYADLTSIAFSSSRFGYLYLLGPACLVQQFRLGGGGREGTLMNSWSAVAPESGLCVPARIEVDDKNHYVYVLDSGNSLLMLFNEDGLYRWALRGAQQAFSKPLGIAVNPDGDELLVADTENNVVQKFTLR